MSDINEKELIILRSLKEEWKSTKGLVTENVDLADRVETSLLLHELREDEFIKKASNGYWQLTTKGKSYLASHDGEPEEETIKTTEELLAEELESETPTLSGKVVDGPAPMQDAQRELVEEPKQSQWSLISGFMEELPEQASLVVGKGGASIVVDGSEFQLEREGDVEAVIRAAELYAGKVA